MNTPKRHHFVPQFLQIRFADDSGVLHYVDNRTDGSVARADASNLLVEKHLYSTIRADGSKDPKLEVRYSRLEGPVASLIKHWAHHILKARLPPSVLEAEKRLWDLFLYEQWRRVPDLHRKLWSDGDARKAVVQALDEYEKRYRKISEQERQSNLTPEAIKIFRHNGRLGSLKSTSRQVITALANKGLVFAVAPSNKRFITGSSPVVKIIGGKTPRLDDKDVEVALAIDPKIVVVAAGPKGQRSIRYVNADWVRHINSAVTRHSTTIVGNPPRLLKSLAEQGLGTKQQLKIDR